MNRDLPTCVSGKDGGDDDAVPSGQRGSDVSDALVIREADGGELDIVASLVVDAYGEFAARMAPDAWSSFAQDIANVRGRTIDAQLLVAERDGRIVGSVTRYPNWRGAQRDASAIRLLAVPPAERGTGVGRALIERCIELARKEGKERLVVTVAPEMEDARDLYDKLGFERAPDLDHEPAPGVRSTGYALSLN
jgi:GNAT superfamily N-acetyltransferase